MALTNVEVKTKSLFLRANLFQKVEDREDFLFFERNTLRLSRNVQEAFTSADEVLTRNLSSTKLIYLTLLERQGFTFPFNLDSSPLQVIDFVNFEDLGANLRAYVFSDMVFQPYY
jgi:predicted DNA-binding protein